MKVVLIAGLAATHTIRWANGLVKAGLEVHVVSNLPPLDKLDPRVIVHMMPFKGTLGYFRMVPRVKSLLKKIQPDIVNAHYISGSGTTARLVNFKPTLLSVWGSDVYLFPYISPLHKLIIKQNLKSATLVASTSHCMAQQTQSLLPSLKDIAITPFGVDTEQFSHIEPIKPVNSDKIVVGTVKKLEHIYGIDTLIQAFAIIYKDLKKHQPTIAKKLFLRLVGPGKDVEKLKRLAKKLNILDRTSFVGWVPYDQVPDELEKLDIYVALSRSESFGVAILEAGMAGRPVLVSNAGGLPEVTVKNKTGLIVPKDSPQESAKALKKLILNPQLRHELAINGREHVKENYSWDKCVQNMIEVYKATIEKHKRLNIS